MDLSDLFGKAQIDTTRTLVLRHRPFEPQLNEILPSLAVDKPEVFNAYQQTQGPKLERAMQSAEHLASFIGHEPGKALFVGLYRIGQSKPMTQTEYWEVEAYRQMKKFGMKGFTPEDGRSSCLWLDLALTDFCASWKGKLIVSWPPPERSWWRRAHRNSFDVLAILEESMLVRPIPRPDKIVLKWEALSDLPKSWVWALTQWRGIYYIFDVSDGKGYVGAAYGEDNLLGRWRTYGRSGHGGNAKLRGRDPKNFQFSVLQTVAPDLDSEKVIQLENAWKERLHTRTYGLNDN